MKKSRKKQLIAEYLFRTANLLQKQSVRDGLTLRQAMLLGTLEEAEGSANLSDLSERFGCTRQNIRQLVDALASKGFVRTEKAADDKRETLVILAEGAAQENTAEVISSVFKGIGEKQLDGTLEWLEKMMDNLKALCTHRAPISSARQSSARTMRAELCRFLSKNTFVNVYHNILRTNHSEYTPKYRTAPAYFRI